MRTRVVVVALCTMSCAAEENAVVTIDRTETRQTIDGFGVAQPGGDLGQAELVQDSAYDLYCFPKLKNATCSTGCFDPTTNACAPPGQSPLPLDLAFSDLNGIGLTILRMRINPKMEPQPGVWDDSDPAQAWIMQQAVARGPVKLIASVWSPPAWMKSNNRTIGGFCSNTGSVCTCNKDCGLHDPGTTACQDDDGPPYCISGTLDADQEFADFLAHAATQYATVNGISFYGLSMTNEPDTCNVPWDTCGWSTSHIASFLNDYLGPTFANNHITTKVIAPEAASWLAIDRIGPGACSPPGPYLHAAEFQPQQYPNAFDRIDIVAGHTYGGTSSDPAQRPHAYGAKKPAWQTEYSAGGSWKIDMTRHTPIDDAVQIHQGLTGAHISAWLWFILFSPGIGSETAFMGYDTTGHFAGSPAFYALGNFSKFIRPGFVQITASVTSAPRDFYASAYQDPITGQLVIVAINRTASAVASRFKVGSSAIATPFVTSSSQNLAQQPDTSLSSAVTVPAMSVVTYVSPPPHRTADMLWRNTNGATQVWLNAIATTASSPGTLDGNWQIQGVGDFDGNQRGDILWRCLPQAPATSCGDAAAGATAIWQDGTSTRTTRPGELDTSFQIRGVGDFDGDGRSDILWRGSDGGVVIWHDANPTRATSPGSPDDAWQIQGVGDFDGNGKSDILWRNTNGTVVIWQDGREVDTWPGSLDNNWQIRGIDDFDGNGQADILWRCHPIAPATSCGDAVAGSVAVWNFSHGNHGWTTWPGALDANWQIAGVGDFDGNGQADILWRCIPRAPATACGAAPSGSTAIWKFENGTYGRTIYPGVQDLGWQIQRVGRFD